jgi:hypothetical protein
MSSAGGKKGGGSETDASGDVNIAQPDAGSADVDMGDAGAPSQDGAAGGKKGKAGGAAAAGEGADAGQDAAGGGSAQPAGERDLVDDIIDKLQSVRGEQALCTLPCAVSTLAAGVAVNAHRHLGHALFGALLTPVKQL